MRIVLAFVAALLFLGSAQAQPRIYNQAELDAMLAPIALQPDGVVSQILIASTLPGEVAAAAGWSRAHPHLRGDDALRAVEYEPWDPAVKTLVAFPELLQRMDESPQWLHDLGQAFLYQEPHVMDTVQALRHRAQAAGHLAASDDYAVYHEGEAIVVQPRTQIVYVRYYDPYVVYGPWWWPHYRPVFWRPWAPRPVFVAHGFFYSKPDWHRRHVHIASRPVHVRQNQVVTGKWQPQKRIIVQPHVRVPESRRRPIVQPHMPAANAFSQPRPVVRQGNGLRKEIHIRQDGSRPRPQVRQGSGLRKERR